MRGSALGYGVEIQIGLDSDFVGFYLARIRLYEGFPYHCAQLTLCLPTGALSCVFL